ncbi:hypothetical protein X566_01690 [Afipia sp. P52-10]|uniref:hypothetical protein n=1 Tax=Afipia sp. P52-10 TaxID=1429916 RepID=UPI0003DF1F3E|nr:hypothetical protein [Afipia sp. P52-10]ETR78895.1 hypothetical protein X566_01690 [Afipia sp. P52-10]
MADEAFALSPINARASLPTDADYEAICNAFMETSRGRWFLSEYAKRNRNADTRLVLDAVERIEAALANQRQAQSEPEPPADLWPELMKAFTKTRIEIAQRLLTDGGDTAAFDSIRSGAEMIRKVSKALRERGWDVRICDVFDTQVSAITDGYTALLAGRSLESSAQTDVLAAFDALAERVETLTGGGETETLDVMVDAVADAMGEDDDFGGAFADAEPETPPPPAPLDEDAAFHDIYDYADDAPVAAETVVTSSSEPLAEAPPPPAPAPQPESTLSRPAMPEPKAETQHPAPATSTLLRRQVPDVSPADDIEIVDVADSRPAAPPRRTTEAPPSFERPRDVAPPKPAPVIPIAEAHVAAPAPAEPAPARTSLGAALLASGLVRGGSETSRSDPLAPFRRMSQAERVAFFT